MFRILRRSALAAGLLSAALIAGAAHRTVAQSPQSGITFQDLGSQNVAGTDWSFTGDYQISAGAWESVTISNYGYCFVGPNDPRAGTAHAGGAFWFAELAPQPPGSDSFAGDLKPGRGGNASGRVTVSATPGTPGATHIEATISGSDLNFFKDNSLQVCLLGST